LTIYFEQNSQPRQTAIYLKEVNIRKEGMPSKNRVLSKHLFLTVGGGIFTKR
jgi:hypothetical protein